MTNMTWIAVPSFVLLALAFGLLMRRIVSWKGTPGGPVGDLEGFSLERYQPMERLLDGADEEFLSAQRGLSGNVARQLRRDRRRVFRAYLRNMRRDFGRIHGALREIMVHSTEDRPDLAAALLRQRWAFSMALAEVECRLALHALGIGTIRIDGLVSALDSLGAELRHVSAAAAAA